jgi:hypothetical protein
MKLLFNAALWGSIAAYSFGQGLPAAAPAGGPSPTKILEIAVQDADSRVGVEALKGLRAARDPSLRPLFSWLSAGRTPTQRHHGVLGLAELESPPHLNPLMLSRVPDNVEQASILGEALANDLVRLEEVEQILAIPRLDPFIELALRARLFREGKAIDVARVTALSTSAGLPTQVLSSILLAQAGNPEPMEVMASRLLGTSDPERGALVGTILEIIRRERLSAASPFLSRFERVYSGLATLNADLLRTWLRIAPKDASPVWTERFTKSTSLADQLRLALAAVDASDIVEPGLFTPIDEAPGEPILAAIGRAGRAIAEKKGVGAAVAEAVSLRYQLFENWAAERASAWSPEDAAAVDRAVLEAAASRSSASEIVFESVPTSAARLGAVDPAFVRSILERGCARADEHLCRAVLTGLLRGRVAPVWTAETPLRWADSTSAGIALIVQARSVEPGRYPAEKVPALTDVASGHPVLLPPGMRAQAAWILAKTKGEADPLLARLLAGE